jgi:hypothetical protein
MSQRVDLVRNSLPSSNELVLETVEETADGIVLRAHTRHLPIGVVARIGLTIIS